MAQHLAEHSPRHPSSKVLALLSSISILNNSKILIPSSAIFPLLVPLLPFLVTTSLHSQRDRQTKQSKEENPRDKVKARKRRD